MSDDVAGERAPSREPDHQTGGRASEDGAPGVRRIEERRQRLSVFAMSDDVAGERAPSREPDHQTGSASEDDTVPTGRTAACGPPSDGTRLVELLRRSARGQEDAFAELYDKTSSRIYGVALRVLRSPDQAAEVTQEVYVEVWRHATRYAPAKGSVSAWMTTMAHRRAIDRVRSTSSELTRDRRYALEAAKPAHDHVWSGVEQRLDAERVRGALARLTAIQRESIVLVYFGGHSHAEVATMLGIPLGTVKTRIRDGLIRLRQALAG
jgi:RNA polymerase sigma-70 factor (ECF subfamily)